MLKKFMSKKGFIGNAPYDVDVSVEVTTVGDKTFIYPTAEITFYGTSGSVTLDFDNWKKDWTSFQMKDVSKLWDLIEDFHIAMEDADEFLKKEKAKGRKRG